MEYCKLPGDCGNLICCAACEKKCEIRCKDRGRGQKCKYLNDKPREVEDGKTILARFNAAKKARKRSNSDESKAKDL